jgi:radical SAM superfamily enzyme YgiQ (UPF0313 family)
LIDLLVRAGFTKVFIGIETPGDAGLSECGKSQNLGRDVVADIKRLQRAGLAVHGGFIVGFDSDTAPTSSSVSSSSSSSPASCSP